MKTLVIINPHAASGTTAQAWHKLEPIVREHFTDLLTVRTESPAHVLTALEDAYNQGVEQVFSVGGDGTNHSLINALIAFHEKHPQAPYFTYGSIPVGTGRDWVRTLNMPLEPHQAIAWLAAAKPKPIDVGYITNEQGETEQFLNIASVGLGGHVARRVNALKKRYPWTFLKQTFEGILEFTPQAVRVEADGELIYEGKSNLVVVANGAIFAHGMKIAPHAHIDDGKLDLLILKENSKLNMLMLLAMVYTGAHIKQPNVIYKQVQRVQIDTPQAELPLEMDGEGVAGKRLTLGIHPQQIPFLR